MPLLKHTVEFTVNPKVTGLGYRLPLPDPCLLGLHAVCAKVAQMSGAARLLDELEEELEGLNVLAGDGSSAGHLAHRLAAIS